MLKAPKRLPEIVEGLVLVFLGFIGVHALMRLYRNEGWEMVVFVVGIFVLMSVIFCSILWIPEPQRSRRDGSSVGDCGSLDFAGDSSDGGGGGDGGD